jgi:DNA-binding transcriptional ArsR family regulator
MTDDRHLLMRGREFQAAIRKARPIADRIYRHPELYPGDKIVIPLADLLGERRRGFSKQSLRVLVAIRDQGPFESLDALAEALARPKARVSQDVKMLESLELVHSRREGRRKILSADQVPILLA